MFHQDSIERPLVNGSGSVSTPKGSRGRKNVQQHINPGSEVGHHHQVYPNGHYPLGYISNLYHQNHVNNDVNHTMNGSGSQFYNSGIPAQQQQQRGPAPQPTFNQQQQQFFPQNPVPLQMPIRHSFHPQPAAPPVQVVPPPSSASPLRWPYSRSVYYCAHCLEKFEMVNDVVSKEFWFDRHMDWGEEARKCVKSHWGKDVPGLFTRKLVCDICSVEVEQERLDKHLTIKHPKWNEKQPTSQQNQSQDTHYRQPPVGPSMNCATGMSSAQQAAQPYPYQQQQQRQPMQYAGGMQNNNSMHFVQMHAGTAQVVNNLDQSRASVINHQHQHSATFRQGNPSVSPPAAGPHPPPQQRPLQQSSMPGGPGSSSNSPIFAGSPYQNAFNEFQSGPPVLNFHPTVDIGSRRTSTTPTASRSLAPFPPHSPISSPSSTASSPHDIYKTMSQIGAEAMMEDISNMVLEPSSSGSTVLLPVASTVVAAKVTSAVQTVAPPTTDIPLPPSSPVPAERLAPPVPEIQSTVTTLVTPDSVPSNQAVAPKGTESPLDSDPADNNQSLATDGDMVTSEATKSEVTIKREANSPGPTATSDPRNMAGQHDPAFATSRLTMLTATPAEQETTTSHKRKPSHSPASSRDGSIPLNSRKTKQARPSPAGQEAVTQVMRKEKALDYGLAKKRGRPPGLSKKDKDKRPKKENDVAAAEPSPVVNTAQPVTPRLPRIFVCRCGEVRHKESAWKEHWKRHLIAKESRPAPEQRLFCPRAKCGYFALDDTDYGLHCAHHIITQRIYRRKCQEEKLLV